MPGLRLGLGLGLHRAAPPAASSPLAISGSPVTTATEDGTYAGFTVAGSGGTPPYSYSLIGTWPTGLSVDSSTGAVSGTPTESGDFSGLGVRVTDAGSNTADLATFSLAVAAAGPTDIALSDTSITTSDTVVGVLTTTGGTSPYTYSII